MPMVGHVAKDAPVAHPFTCAFPVNTVGAQQGRGPQQAVDQFDTNCGNGVMTNGTNLSSLPTASGVAHDHTFAGAWVADLVARYGRADAGGVPLYSLGNEPGLWPATHRHVHPANPTYDELASKTIAWAGAVRDADPSAKVLAFSEWAWPNYFCSPADGAPAVACSPTVGAGLPDRAAHGGKPLVNWLLEQVRVAGQGQGRRLIDYIDVHYYRQGGTTTDVTRSLWDPTYADPSWIADTIRLIPRMEEWVAQELPGIGTAITEYNLSIPGQPVDNVLIQADALGIFGREGLDLATRFDLVEYPPSPGDDGPPDATRRIYDAFRIYRNYDGIGGKFGDTRVRAASADQSALAVYGAQRSGDGALTLVLVNKSASELTSPLTVSGFSASGPAKAYRWTAAAPGVAAAGEVALSGSVAVPAKSITLLVAPGIAAVPGGGTTGPGTTPPPGGKPATAKRCKVPKLVGRKLADARKLLRKRGCKTGRVTRVASKRRKGRVVRQSVKAGRSVKAGTKVALRVSKGRARRR
jgi:hypothetical protein